jgi:hypothetical protein
MVMESPFRVMIYDVDFNPVGFLVDTIYENWVPAWDDNPYGNFSVAADNPHIAALQAPGARVTVVYTADPGKVLLSGFVESWQADVTEYGEATFQVIGDKKMLEDILWFPAPANPLRPTSISDLGQAWVRDTSKPLVPGTVTNQYPYYRWPAGVGATAETAIKHAIKVQMVDRLGMNVKIMPDLRRGPDVTDVLAAVRMDPLSEVLTPLTAASDLSVVVWQNELGSTYNIDVVESGTWVQPLTPESGIILEGSYTTTRPAATRAITGGGGETSARIFIGQEGPGFQTALERKWGVIREMFRDYGSGNGDLEWPANTPDANKVVKYYPFVAPAADWKDYLTRLRAAETKALEDHRQKSNLALKLSETETFRFGAGGVQVGDWVTITIRGQDFTDRIARVYLTYTRENGVLVQPEVGERTDDPDAQLARFVTGVAKALRRTLTSR